MKAWIARDKNGEVYLHREKPTRFINGVFASDDWWILERCDFPIVTFEKSPVEVEIVLKKALDAHYKDISRYEELIEMVTEMRKAQKEANDLIAQVECYEEAMGHIKKAEELEQRVDKWLEGEAL